MTAHARRLVRAIGLIVLLLAWTSSCGDATGPDSGPHRLEIRSGGEQTGVYGELLPEPIVVRVTRGGEPVAGLEVDWWAIPPRVGPHLVSTLCGFASRIDPPHFGRSTTTTDSEGMTSNQWQGESVSEPTEPTDCKMRIRAMPPERDTVLAQDTAYATWRYESP